MTSLLEAENISVWRGDNLLLHEVNLSIESGDIVQVLGANGSGKTTLLRILCGIGIADDGDVLWRGETITRARDQFHAELLYLGHKSGIKSSLTPIENLLFFSELAGIKNSEDVRQNILAALTELALQEKANIPCKNLSAGQQRRVSLARLILEPATLWVLDEPLTALDTAGLQWVENQVAVHVEKGGAVVLTSHTNFNAGQASVRRFELT